jgi:hypothetical protein
LPAAIGMHNAMPCPASTSMRIELKVSHSTGDAWFDASGSENALEVLALILATETEERFGS